MNTNYINFYININSIVNTIYPQFTLYYIGIKFELYLQWFTAVICIGLTKWLTAVACLYVTLLTLTQI